MKKIIKLHGKEIEYTLKISKRAKKLRLAVYCGGSFVVTAPQNLRENHIERFIVKKSRWVTDKINYFKNVPGGNFVANKKSAKKDYKKNKNIAQSLAEKKVEFFNLSYKFKFNRICIRNQKTRWGSCSKKGNLNFNYKIISLPERLADYIVVHELCHLGEFNHSKSFWELVAKTIPDYKIARRDLKKNQINFS